MPGTRIDRWLFAILHSIWISELRACHVRQGQGFVASDELLAPDTREQDETHLHYLKVMQRVNMLPEAQRNTVFGVCRRFYLSGSREHHGGADRYRNEPTGDGTGNAGSVCRCLAPVKEKRS